MVVILIEVTAWGLFATVGGLLEVWTWLTCSSALASFDFCWDSFRLALETSSDWISGVDISWLMSLTIAGTFRLGSDHGITSFLPDWQQRPLY